MRDEILTVILINFVVFFRTLRYGLVVDDVKRFSDKEGASQSFLKRFLRSLHGSTVRVPVEGDHLTTILIHTTVSALVCAAFGFWPAVLFSVHPVNNQVSVWLNGKRYGIAAILCLIMYTVRPWGLLVYPFVPLWHYNALVTPALYLFTPHWRWILVIPVLCFLFKDHIIILIRKFRGRYSLIPDCDVRKVRIGKLPIYFKTLAYYTQHYLFPRKMSFFHTFLDTHGFSEEDDKKWCAPDGWFWGGVAVFAALVTGAIVTRGTAVGVGLMWWLLFISQWCNFPITLTQHTSDRVCYLAGAGLTAAVSGAISYVPDLTVRMCLYTAVGVYYLTVLCFYVTKYKNIDDFVLNGINVFPDQIRTYRFVVRAFMEDKKWFHAVVYCARGLHYRPRDFTLNLFMAKIMNMLNQKPEAAKYVNIAACNLITGHEDANREAVSKTRSLIAGPLTPSDIVY